MIAGTSPPGRFARGLTASSLAVLAGLAGCQSYAPRPIDPALHRAEFLGRTPASPEVARFAESLARNPEPARAFDPSDGLSVDEAEVVALVYNADLRAARARAGVTAAASATARLWEDPVLGTDLVRIVQSTPHPWMVFTSLGLTIPISGRLELEKRRAGAEHAAELVRVYQAEWGTRVAVRRAFAEWSAAAHRRDVLRQLVGQLDELLSLVGRIERAGELARIEAGLFRLEHATRAADLEQAGADVAEREQTLRRLLGLAPSAPVTLVPSELRAGGEPDPAGLLPLAEASNPTLAVARARHEAAERRLELEVRRQYPDLQIGPGYGREDGMDQALLNLSIPLPVLNRNRQGIATAAAEREAATVEYQAAAEGLAADLELAVVRLRAALARSRTLEEALVPLVDQQYADARRVAELGEVNTLLLLETLTRQQDAKLTLIGARLAERLSALEIESLVGPADERAAAAHPVEEDSTP